MTHALHLAAVAALLLALALSLTQADPAQAHVKAYFYPGNLAIRNADTPRGDGHFSVGGVCGGVNRWGQRGWTVVRNGQTLCTRINYNGGHNVPQNAFRGMMRCGRPDQQQDIQNSANLMFTNDTNPPPAAGGMSVPAAQANQIWDGYYMCVKLIPQDIFGSPIDNNLARMCTLSIADQRNWGACFDLYLMDNTTDIPPVTPAPTMSPLDPVLQEPANIPQAQGTYQVLDCDASSGGKCCLQGYIGITADGKAAARLRGNSPASQCFDITNFGWQDYQFTLKRVPFTNNSFQGNIYLYPGYNGLNYWYAAQNLSVVLFVSDAGASISVTNIGLDAPLVSDHTFGTYTSLDQGVALQLIPYPTGVPAQPLEWWIIVAIVGGIVTLYLVGGVLLNRCCGEKKCRHPHIHVVLVQLGCVKRDKRKVLDPEFKGFSVHLPPNWHAAIDDKSGETYYFNTVTNEVTWTRPKPTVAEMEG